MKRVAIIFECADDGALDEMRLPAGTTRHVVGVLTGDDARDEVRLRQTLEVLSKVKPA